MHELSSCSSVAMRRSTCKKPCRSPLAATAVSMNPKRWRNFSYVRRLNLV